MTLETRLGLIERLRAVLESADAAYKQGAVPNPALVTTLRGEHPADIAEAISEGGFTDDEAHLIFAALDAARAAEVLDEADPDLAVTLITEADPARAADLLDRLPTDDAARIVAEVAEDAPQQAETLLADLTRRNPEDAADLRELLSYADETAGRLMTPDFFRLSQSQTVAEAFTAIRTHADGHETLTDLYVVEEVPGGEKLIGLVNLRHLLRADPYRRIGDVMIREPLTVSVDTPQREAARMISKYDFLAVPVLDRNGYLAGVFTVDDALDVLVEEHNEEFFRVVGSDAEEMERRTPAQIARLRLPWLLGTMALELIAGVVISHYDWVLKEVVLLASFMPVISAISGNVGLQAAAIIVRGLETGHVSVSGLGRAVRREASTALLLALCCGSVLGTVGAFWSHKWTFGLVIGGAMTASMLTASLLGTSVPIASKRMGFDPATTAGPFETAFQDVIGFGVFLWLASLLLPYLK